MNLLDQVLRQTALASMAGALGGEAADEALREVARRYRGQEFALDPIGVELVHASLSNQFPILGSGDRDWRTISRRIAQTLFDDPVAHAEFLALWNRLTAEQ